MKPKNLILAVLCTILMSAGIAEAQDVQLLVAARNDCLDSSAIKTSTLYNVNLPTSQVEPIGSIGFLGITALEFLGDGRLVGSASDDAPDRDPKRAILIDISPNTGASSLIGEIGDDETLGECGRAPGLTYDHTTNTLFATGDSCPDNNDDFLQTINQLTGQGTQVGSYMPFNGSGNGIAIRDDGVIFVSAAEELITVNPQTGAPTKIADIQIIVESDDFIFINALAFHPVTGQLYGTTVDQSDPPNGKSSKLIILDTETGETQIVGNLPDCSDGLVFRILPSRHIPTLSEWGLIAMAGILGIVGFMVIRRRKVAA